MCGVHVVHLKIAVRVLLVENAKHRAFLTLTTNVLLNTMVKVSVPKLETVLS